MKAILRSATFVAALAFAASALAQMTPDAPIKNFKLPMFNNAGVKVWDLRGEEAKYLNRDQVDLFQMRLKIFENDGSGNVRLEIESPHASVFPNQHTVSGPDKIRVLNADFEISGSDYTWRGREQSVSIRKDVHVVFKSPLQDILK